MEFFILGYGGKKKTVELDRVPDTDVAWIMGQKHPRGRVKQPLRCTLAAKSMRREMPAMFLDHHCFPLFSDRLLAILDDAGVETILDRYRVELVGSDGTKHTGYKAVNIGAIACADLKKSEYFEEGNEAPLMAFDHLVLKPKKVVGQLFFRVAEAVPIVLVAQPLKEAIEAAKLVGVGFKSLDDPSAY